MSRLFGLKSWVLLALAVQSSEARPPDLRSDTPLTAQRIVEIADRVLNPDPMFRARSTLIEYVHAEPRAKTTVVVYSKIDDETGQFRNLVRFVAPARDAGKLVLLTGSRLWFYDPAARSSIRISPQQRLLGQAADADVMSVNLALNYTATLVGEERIADVERNRRDVWHLELRPASDRAMYDRIEYWIDRLSFELVKGRFYADSGRVLKISYFRTIPINPEENGSQTVIVDALDPNLITTITTESYEVTDIPDLWFQRQILPKLRLD